MDNSELPEFLDCEQVRRVDQFAINQLGIPGLVLMENAARGFTDLLTQQSIRSGVVVVCGKGNNGGDGLAIVRHLLVRGITAKAIMTSDPGELANDALTNYQILNKVAPLAIEQLEESYDDILGQLIEVNGQRADWIVDAILGTGTRGEIKDPYAKLIDLINVSNSNVMAVDIPSGLDGDTGVSLGHTIRANITGTFVRAKSGFQNEKAKEFLGIVHELDIGIPRSVICQAIM